jgi:hypothetical protein
LVVLLDPFGFPQVPWAIQACHPNINWIDRADLMEQRQQKDQAQHHDETIETS